MNQFQIKINDIFETEIIELEYRPVINEYIQHKGKSYIIKVVLHPTEIKTLTLLFLEAINK